MLIDVEWIHYSPLATQAGLRSKFDDAFQAGLLLVHPEASCFVAAAKCDFGSMERA